MSNNLNYNELNRETSTLRKPHHISEVTSINPDGTRYIYGIPAYNTKQIEKTFSVGQNNNGSDLYNCNTQGVISSSSYTNTDASSSNSRGIDHYFNQRELPGYAHSYLLTAVLSADYVDLTGDGPTEDDLGGYTKLNYSKEQNKHKWRTPYAGANLNRGQLSTLQDDKASIVYGEKEVWYLHTIETKSHIAEFHLSSRRDAMEANNLNQGNQGSSKVKKLDKIVLFSKVDRLKNGVNATPIKTVHFEYSYDLCPDVKNFEQMSLVNPPAHSLYNYDNSYNWNEEDKRGKLTLHKVYFTYGKSNMGRSNPYVFEYKGPNPSYHLKSYDRWGNYKQNDCLLPNEEFPYVKQDKTVADINASAWCLTDIRMPSGGKIQVTYESDDYAYVQDQKAMQMELISGFSEELTTGTLSSNLYSKGDEHNYLYFNIKEGHSVNDYIPNLKKQLYFNCYINLNGKNGSKSVKEFVSGFAWDSSLFLVLTWPGRWARRRCP